MDLIYLKNNMDKENFIEQKIESMKRHTSRLVPQSQRELFLSELEDILQDQQALHKTELQSILDNGHGGGNWRRIIISLLNKYE